MAFTETVIIQTNTDQFAIQRSAAKSLLLVAPIDAGASVSADVVIEYTRATDAETDHGVGSFLALGVRAALEEGLPSVFAVGMAEDGASPFVDPAVTSGTSGTLANVPAYSVTGATNDGIAYSTITYTAGDPSLESPAAGELIVNLATGAWESGDAATGGGIVVTYEVYDIASALSAASEHRIEYMSIAGHPYSAQNFGLYDALVDEADTRNRLVAAAMPSAITKEDAKPIAEARKSGRISLLAAKYTGDLTSAWAAMRARMSVGGTSKEQAAPASIAYTGGYVRSEYGDEEDLSGGVTLHDVGVNAIYEDSGEFYVTNDRSTAQHDDFERFHSTRRAIRFVEVSIEDDLRTMRRSSSTAVPFTQSGIGVIETTLLKTMAAMKTGGVIDRSTVTMPSFDSIVETDRLNRVVRDIEVSVRLSGQVHLFSLELNVAV